MTFIEVTKCNVCGGKDISPVCYLPEFPVILRPLPWEVIVHLKKRDIPATMPLRVGICRSCGHMLLLLRPADKILSEIYESFYGTYLSGLELGFGTADSDYFLRVFRQKVEPELLPGSRVLEIGCYDGYILFHLAKDGFEVCGCDPSDGAKIGQERGIPIIRAFYSANLFPPKHFDVLVNRHLLEHISSPVDFVASFCEIVKESGWVIIETPNAAYYLRHGLLGSFHLEHISAFTAPSLATCMQKAGFRVKWMSSDSRNLIAICVLKAESEHSDVEAPRIEELVEQARVFNHRFSVYLSELNSLIEDIALHGSTIAIWGAGSFGASILTLARTLSKRVVGIIDRDPRKHGLSFYNLNIKVMPPEYLVEHPVDYIIICSQYGPEIIGDIRDRYGLRSAIVLLEPKIEIIE